MPYNPLGACALGVSVVDHDPWTALYPAWMRKRNLIAPNDQSRLFVSAIRQPGYVRKAFANPPHLAEPRRRNARLQAPFQSGKRRRLSGFDDKAGVEDLELGPARHSIAGLDVAEREAPSRKRGDSGRVLKQLALTAPAFEG